VRIFGIDPGSVRTGYGCVETDGRAVRLVACGAITAGTGDGFPQRLARIHRQLSALLEGCHPDYVAVESVFHASNVHSALKLGHARGVALLAAVDAGCPVVEYSPAEIKRAVVGYGRAEKHQVQYMIRILLGLAESPSPHDAADALAVAICHLHSIPPAGIRDSGLGTGASGLGTRGSGLGTGDLGLAARDSRKPRSWRQYRPPANG
jgi:crossover junction endodeoxyribonuclease RuvC